MSSMSEAAPAGTTVFGVDGTASMSWAKEHISATKIVER